MSFCCCGQSAYSPFVPRRTKLCGQSHYEIENLGDQPRKLYYLPRSKCTSEMQLKKSRSACCQPSSKHVIKRGDAFEIKLVGFQVKKYDFGISAWSGNEIVLTSTQDMVRNPETPIERIHFHYEKNKTKGSKRPNTFVKVPHSTSFLYGDLGDNESRNGARKRKKSATKSVAFRLRIVEMDKVSKPIIEAISNAGDAAGVVKGLSAIPFLGLVSPILGFAGSAGKKLLERHIKRDKVLNEDLLFQLCSEDTTDVAGRFLRYGYYFVLSEETNFELYACECNQDNMRLHLKVKNEENYFPLKNVNYVVLEVSEPSGAFPLTSNYSKLQDIDDRMRNILRAVNRKKNATIPQMIAKENSYILDRMDSFESLVGLKFDSE